MNDSLRPAGKLTLAIDIGGTRLKASVLDEQGGMIEPAQRVDTPKPATPDAVVQALLEVIARLGPFDRISIGFPGVVRRGAVLTAPNLGTDAWRGFPLAARLSERLGKPARMMNDAMVQGLGVIEGSGLECVITLGTGFGFALFDNGRPAPHLELSRHPVHRGKIYDDWLGNAALQKIGKKRWNRRLRKVIAWIEALVNYDTLLIGGGNARHVTGELPPNVRLVSNQAGITGGIKLWDPALDQVVANA